ncbi:hypothetical protein LOAG_09099 [Loa loa]|uniref:Uncharacterized protein n=1 Tax=Loa loa TaxID=7209 RepID=A0A1S0TT36_LOALO|nr:hypothetical protein LOAG_09099 [Loa loa]EFO19394.2 hypothetical protein LOAG_09099 [Loa loa]
MESLIVRYGYDQWWKGTGEHLNVLDYSFTKKSTIENHSLKAYDYCSEFEWGRVAILNKREKLSCQTIQVLN